MFRAKALRLELLKSTATPDEGPSLDSCIPTNESLFSLIWSLSSVSTFPKLIANCWQLVRHFGYRASFSCM